ncbi:hypothetical protein G6L12_31360 [Agrobacterium rhizogenes]|nr:hypothetical protein [Rhizobium rhizogenes]NTF79000.1 hypothetical protein [Rhizobium rhizogenes]
MKISIAIKNTTSTDYRVHIFDMFGGSSVEVLNSPFALAAGETSVSFQVNASGDGSGRVAYECELGPSLPDIEVHDGDTYEIR